MKELSGIGAKTAEVIAQSLRGEEPTYLRKLDADPEPNPAALAEPAPIIAPFAFNCSILGS